MREKILKRVESFLHNFDLNEQENRPEAIWLAAQYDAWRKSCGNLSKGAADEEIYRRMYGKAPGKSSDLNKIRFWRTGRHLPVDRKEAERFVDQMNFNPEQKRFFLRNYLELSYFENEQEREEALELLEELKQEYLQKVYPEKMNKIGGKIRPERNFRHLYYLDAISYISSPKPERKEINEEQERMLSASFGSELLRIQRMDGGISRKTMIRHLILLGSPFVSEEQMNRWLKQLGYAPLNAGHITTDHIALDALVIQILSCYESLASGREYRECGTLLRAVCAQTDKYLQANKLDKWRFMYFKALRNICEERMEF